MIERLLNEITSLLAGGLAEKKKTKRRMNYAGCKLDQDQELEVIHSMIPITCRKEIEELLKWLKLRAMRLLNDYWPAVERVAQQLVEKRCLSGAEVRKLVKDIYPFYLAENELHQ